MEASEKCDSCDYTECLETAAGGIQVPAEGELQKGGIF